MARSHVDATVAERRLKPIYDCLDNGNNKKALQEAEKLLKKQKEFKCAKVLKALAMLRLGRQSECEVIMEEVRTNEPVDEPTLQAMTICYRELQRLDLVVEIFEKACSKDPQNEDLLSHLFMSHVRIGNYKKQQQVAMALYKLKPKKPYYLWSVMSIYMQALEGEQTLAQTMLLPLAQKMITKFINDNGIEDKNELQLQLMILEGKSEYKEALELLTNPQSSILNISSMPDYLSYQRACYLNHLQRYPESVSAFKQLINERPEQWDYYLKYFDAVEELEKLGWTPSEEPAGDNTLDHSLKMAFDFISKNILDSPKPIRSSYVARIELLKRMKLKEESEELEDNLLERLFEYYQIFGTKPGGMPDMMAFLETIPLQEATLSSLLDKIYVNSAKDTTPTNVNQLYRHIIYYHLAQYGGYFKKMDVASKLKLVEELCQYYELGLTFGKELLSTDYQFSDSYSLLIVILLLEVWEETKQEKYYVNALAHLELTLKHSESNFHIKLVLIKLYNMIGACSATFDIYKSLDIKHIQQETLGHMFSYPLLSTGHHVLANQIISQALRFYTSNFKDTVDYLISAYRFGQFTKIPEIVKFKRKLTNSLYSNTIIVEQRLQELFIEAQSPQSITRVFNSMKLDPEKELVDYSQLNDNKDTSCIRSWKKEDAAKLKELNKKSADEEVQWLKYRKLLLRCLYTSHLVEHGQREGSTSPVSDIPNGVHSTVSALLPKLIEELKLHLESINHSNLNKTWFPISYPGPSRLVRFLERPANQRLIVSMLQLVVYIHNGKATEESELVLKSSFIEDYKNFLTELRKNYLENGTGLSILESRNILEDLTNATETYLVISILANRCVAYLRPAKAGANRRKRKTTTSKEIETLANFSVFLEGLKQTGSTYLSLIEDVKNHFELQKLSTLSLNTTPSFITEEMSTLVLDKIDKSYSSSFNELSQLIKNKLKLLEALVC